MILPKRFVYDLAERERLLSSGYQNTDECKELTFKINNELDHMTNTQQEEAEDVMNQLAKNTAAETD